MREQISRILWYLAYPLRDLAALGRTARTVVDHALADDLSGVPNADAVRVGTVIASTFAGGVLMAFAMLRYGWPAAQAIWAVPGVWVAWWLATRDGYDEHQKRVQTDSIAADANTQIKWADPNEVFVENAVWDQRGICQFDLCYPRDWADSNETNRKKVESHVIGKLPGRRKWRAEWDTERDFVTFAVHDPQIPDVALLELHPRMPWNRIPVGVGPGGKTYCIDLRRTPHIIVVARSGAGKSVVLRAAIAAVLAKWWKFITRSDRLQTIILDPKRIEMKSLRGMPGVVKVVTDPQEMQDTIVEWRDKMRAWYDAKERGHVKAKLNTLLVIDEFAELMDVVPNRELVRSSIDAIARLSRSCRLHLLLATQQPNVAQNLSGAARENVVAIATTAMSPEGSKMATGNASTFRSETDGGIASEHPGRCAYAYGDVSGQFQAYWVEDPGELNEDLPPDVAKRMLEAAKQVFPEPDPERVAAEMARPEPSANGSEPVSTTGRRGLTEDDL